MFRAFVLGRAAGTWTISRQGVALEPFRRLTRADRAALESEEKHVTRFLGG